VGTTTENICKLTSDAKSIITLHKVVVESTIKGPAFLTVTVVVEGGKVVFEDGTSAQIKVPNFLPPIPGRRYLWYLRRAPTVPLKGLDHSIEPSGAFALTAGPLGLFDLSSRERTYVMPSGIPSAQLTQRLLKKRLSPEAFLTHVRELAR
jgi:hypothetical protein